MAVVAVMEVLETKPMATLLPIFRIHQQPTLRLRQLLQRSLVILVLIHRQPLPLRHPLQEQRMW